MSPTSYQAAPLRDVKNYYGGERGIRTPAPFPTCWFSRPVPSTGLGYFSVINIFVFQRQIDYNIYFFTMSTENQFFFIFFWFFPLFLCIKSNVLIKKLLMEYFLNWCLRPDLNRHGIWLPQDFKSCASTNFATQARGVPYKIRTCDPLIKSQMLYQLS